MSGKFYKSRNKCALYTILILNFMSPIAFAQYQKPQILNLLKWKESQLNYEDMIRRKE